MYQLNSLIHVYIFLHSSKSLKNKKNLPGFICSQNGDLLSHVSTPGANIIHDITTVIKSTNAYINFAKPEFPQLWGHIAQVVETQVPVRQQAKLPKLNTPPIVIEGINLKKFSSF